MIIFVNGKKIETRQNINIFDLINQLKISNQRIAAEVNTEIVSKSSYKNFTLNQNDKVEIIKAVGGG